MKIGIGKLPKHVLTLLRQTIDKPNVYIYPEFFDDKKALIGKKYKQYYLRLLKRVNEIRIALWPDYLYEDAYNLARFDFTWIFPLHSLNEIPRVLKLSDKMEIWLGFPNDKALRDYTLSAFLEQARKYGFKTWLLGLKPKFMKYLHLFNGVDVTTLSVRGKQYANLKNPKFFQEYISFILKIADIKERFNPLTLYLP